MFMKIGKERPQKEKQNSSVNAMKVKEKKPIKFNFSRNLGV